MCRNGGDGTRHNKAEEKVEESACGSELLNMYVYKQEGRRKKSSNTQSRKGRQKKHDRLVCLLPQRKKSKEKER